MSGVLATTSYQALRERFGARRHPRNPDDVTLFRARSPPRTSWEAARSVNAQELKR